MFLLCFSRWTIGYLKLGKNRLGQNRLGNNIAIALCLAALAGFSVVRAQSPVLKNSLKQIVLGMVWEPVSFNPVRGIDSGSYTAASLVYDGLVKYDRTMTLKPALAESYAISDDGLTYRFKLRPNLRFSNGEPLTL